MHFTYEQEARSDLGQGDLIKRTPEVEALLREVHPHYYFNTSYKFFIILTQSCDLVRRDGNPCKARYISIAAVRPLKLVIERELTKHQSDEIERKLNFCGQDKQNKLVLFMERLLNNNEDEFFFLYREPEAELTEDHCAFLHLSIAVKANPHYGTLLSARILQLTDSFQHKLGYLVGNLYSRIATEDWLPDNCDRKTFGLLKTKPLREEAGITWLDKQAHRAVLEKLKSLASPSLQDLKEAVQEYKMSQETKKKRLLNALREVLNQFDIESPNLENIVRRLENHPEFQTLTR